MLETIPDSEARSEPEVNILCVDDEKNILRALTRIFRHESFGVLTATSGKEGLEILKNSDNIGLIISDQQMPEMSGTDFLQSVAQLFPDIPRIILTGYATMDAAVAAINQGGACHFLSKPWDAKELLQVVRGGLERFRLTRENQRLTLLVNRQNEELAEWNGNLKKRVLLQTKQIRVQLELQESHSSEIFTAVVEAFFDLLGQRNTRISSHSLKVAELAEQIAEKLGLDYRLREEVRVAALLHDVGLLGLPDRLLFKAASLMNPDEVKEFRSHSIKGEAVVKKIKVLRDVGLFIRHHHESYDGTGYPDALAGEEIPLGARIIALANWLDNTVTKEMSREARYLVSKKLDREMGHLFDPTLASAAKSAMIQLLSDTQEQRDLSEESMAVADLHPGMILSRKLYSVKGTLLLERGTPLDEETIESLWRYLGIGDLVTELHVLQTSIESREVPLTNLREGMVLTQDIYDVHGGVILQRGRRITAESLNTIRRQSRAIPLATVAHVRRMSNGGQPLTPP